MYVYELARNLIKLDCEVTVASPFVGGKLTELAIGKGIQVSNINQLTAQSFDVLHLQHKPVTEFLVAKYPLIKKVCSIHSEIISLEEPVVHESIKHYIAVRPAIKTLLIQRHRIPPEKISVIYNPIDEERFQSSHLKPANSLLFVGTIDYLRRDTIFDLIKYTESKKMDFWLIGEDNGDYLASILRFQHVKYSKSIPNVEAYVQRCTETAGILLGRTTIEGWMCGKSGWIYDVDEKGKILNKTFASPPEDMRQFHSSVVSKKILDLY